MAIREVTFDSPTPVRDAAYEDWTEEDRQREGWHENPIHFPKDAFDGGWSAAVEFATERVQAVLDLLPELDGPGDAAEELKTLIRRLQRTTGSA